MRKQSLLVLLLGAVVLFAVTVSVSAQQNDKPKATASPLVRLLQSKGILTAEEVAEVSQASTSGEADLRLAQLLFTKGVISKEDYEQAVGGSIVSVSSGGANGATLIPAVLRTPAGSPGPGTSAPEPDKPAAPKVIPAIAPIRVFPVDTPKREGIIPDFKLGPVRVKPYGFFKTSMVYDSSSQQGNDFPLPGFLGDTGPDAGQEFHIKARALRIGSNFEWLDISPKLALTARVEFDFEGNFERASNRNISSIRSTAISIRLGWARLDYHATKETAVFALAGQDWTPFGSSTLPPLFETTGLGVGFGSLYERLPQFRFGLTHDFGAFKLQPEIAIVMPSYGNLPANLFANTGAPTTSALTAATTNVTTGVENQLAFGERQGADSGRPEVQGRIALQFQVDKAKGVAPAQIIVSFMEGERTAIVPKANIPLLTACVPVPPAVSCGLPANTFQAIFPFGVKTNSSRWGASGEVQIPTRYVTLIAKMYTGSDLRFYFAGQLLSNYNDVQGLRTQNAAGALVTGSITGPSIDGSSLVAFGIDAGGNVRIAPQRPVRAQGGFVNLGFPLGRLVGANPDGRNAGWQLYLHYGIDFAKVRDLRRLAGTAGIREKSDVMAVTLQYKLNNWVSFVVEQSQYRTRAIPGSVSLPLFRGIPSREAKDSRTEIGTLFTF
jgi:hypothetical protein